MGTEERRRGWMKADESGFTELLHINTFLFHIVFYVHIILGYLGKNIYIKIYFI